MYDDESGSYMNHKPIELLCGSTAVFDVDSMMGYRCTECFAMVGSMGMPPSCKDLYDQADVIDKLRGN